MQLLSLIHILPYESGIASPSDLAMPTAPMRVTPIATMKPTEPFITARIIMYASEPSKVIRLAIITTPLPVSYTHLDVYKRQHQDLWNKVFATMSKDQIEQTQNLPYDEVLKSQVEANKASFSEEELKTLEEDIKTISEIEKQIAEASAKASK